MTSNYWTFEPHSNRKSFHEAMIRPSLTVFMAIFSLMVIGINAQFDQVAFENSNDPKVVSKSITGESVPKTGLNGTTSMTPSKGSSNKDWIIGFAICAVILIVVIVIILVIAFRITKKRKPTRIPVTAGSKKHQFREL